MSAPTDDTVFIELRPGDAAYLRDRASRAFTTAIQGGPTWQQWQRILGAIDAALPPKPKVKA